MNWHLKPILKLHEAMERGEITAETLTHHFLERMEAHDHRINAFISCQKNEALERAKELDRSPKNTPLHGIPIAHKDNFCTQGVKTTCASRMLDNFIPPYDATMVSRLQSAGALCLGKTNMDEFAMGSGSLYSFYGPVKNPWDLMRVPGGSSGGSAAAVAAGLAPLASGSDTGGSIRQPASLCGVTGFKPTYGRISRHGLIAFASSLDTPGFFARFAQDIALAMTYASGPDSHDSTASKREKEDYLKALEDPLPKLRVGLPKGVFDNLRPEALERMQSMLKLLESLGATMVDIDLSTLQHGIPVYYIIASAEASTNLSRYDGVRYGHRSENIKTLEDLYENSRSEGFGAEVKRRIITGTFVLSASSYETYYLPALKIRRAVHDEFRRAFEDVDLIAMPSAPDVAFEAGIQRNPTDLYKEDYYTIPANLAGLPALSQSAGLVDGLPLGFQLIGPQFQDALVLRTAHALQGISEFHLEAPRL